MLSEGIFGYIRISEIITKKIECSGVSTYKEEIWMKLWMVESILNEEGYDECFQCEWSMWLIVWKGRMIIYKHITEKKYCRNTSTNTHEI